LIIDNIGDLNDGNGDGINPNCLVCMFHNHDFIEDFVCFTLAALTLAALTRNFDKKSEKPNKKFPLTFVIPLLTIATNLISLKH
jgi:hypothetical protein